MPNNTVIIGLDVHDDFLREEMCCLCEDCALHYEKLIHDTQILGVMPGLANYIAKQIREYWGGEALW